MKRIAIIAHRGASLNLPENTLASIKQAITDQADYVEIDVRLSKDEIPIIFHDDTVWRTTNADEDIKIESLNAEQIRSLDAGSWFDSQYKEEKVPLLEEVLQVNFGNTGLFLELKEGTDSEILVSNTLKLITRNLHQKLIIGSFSPSVIRELQKQASHIPIIGIAEKIDEVLTFCYMGLTHLAVDYRILTKTSIPLFTKEPRTIWAFTVDDSEVAKDLVEIGVTGIITNCPSKIAKLMH